MLILYEHPFALYCQKVLVALKELGVAYDVLEKQRDFDRPGQPTSTATTDVTHRAAPLVVVARLI